jgi:hypothetical protein
MSETKFDPTPFTDPFSQDVAIELEKNDSLSGGFRDQFIIPTKADLVREKLQSGMKQVSISKDHIILI